MTSRELVSRIRESPGYNRCDLSRLFAGAGSFSAVVSALTEPFRFQRVELVAALDATGFALGGAVAARLQTGLVLIRKPGKAAWQTEVQEFTDYKNVRDFFHLVSDSVSPGQRVLLVDDWSETGAQAVAAIQLLERAKAVVIGAAFINLDHRVKSDPRLQSYQLHSVVDYDAHLNPP